MGTWAMSLNAPYGARCFLTVSIYSIQKTLKLYVLMHLMALGAF